MVFYDWLLLLSIMFSRFIYVVVCICSLFLFIAKLYSILWMHTTFWLSIHQLIFPPVALVKNAAVNTDVQAFVWACIFISLGYISRSRIAESRSNFMVIIRRNCQTAFQSGCTILHSYQQYIRIPIFPPPYLHFRLSFWLKTF